tara:strand:- start:5969 stop:6202 length:234 start_codon:yes stop_codon:yes gene_type:complete
MKNDLEALAALFCSIALIVMVTLLFSAAAQWLAGVAYRLGIISVAAQWTIYLMSLCLCIGFVLTVAGRLATGEWWFR